jgi:hypothetical protein
MFTKRKRWSDYYYYGTQWNCSLDKRNMAIKKIFFLLKLHIVAVNPVKCPGLVYSIKNQFQTSKLSFSQELTEFLLHWTGII